MYPKENVGIIEDMIEFMIGVYWRPVINSPETLKIIENIVKKVEIRFWRLKNLIKIW